MLPVFVPNFSWVIENRLAGAVYPRSEEMLGWLRQRGVRALLTLSEQSMPLDMLRRQGIEMVHVPVVDFTAPTLLQIERAVGSIDGFLARGLPVTVHCRMGRGRTGTILSCYLVSQGVSAQNAIMLVCAKRPGSIDTLGQEAAIALYEQHLRR